MKKFGLIGESLSHSYSPKIHNLFGSYPYELLETSKEALQSLIQNPAYGGFNVTIPYKKTALALCDHLSPEAEAIGSVNTLVKKDDGLWGYNTDINGFIYLLNSANIRPKGMKCLVLGSGGSSLMVQKALDDLDAKAIIVISRTGENNYQNLARHQDAQLVVNTTPVGMYPNNGLSPVELSLFPHLQGVVDLIYNPHLTKLVLDAKALDIPATGGLGMLVAQARRASELFQNKEITPQKMEWVLKQIEKDRLNLILIGMPGSGKTTLGRELAGELNKTFVDIDQEIEQAEGLSISAIFDKYGEEHFRNLETAMLSRFCTQSGLVISTGGGVVTQKRNYPILKQNGSILWIKRDLPKLELKGRPLSKSKEALQTLFDQRQHCYAKWSDCTIENDKMVCK